MNLDFSRCKTVKDVQNVFKKSGFQKSIGMIRREFRKAFPIYRFVHHEEGFVTREEVPPTEDGNSPKEKE